MCLVLTLTALTFLVALQSFSSLRGRLLQVMVVDICPICCLTALRAFVRPHRDIKSLNTFFIVIANWLIQALTDILFDIQA